MLKDYKFKPGDKVRIISPNAPTREYFREHYPHLNSLEYTPNQSDILTIAKLGGNPFTIHSSNTYRIVEDGGIYIWEEEWLELAYSRISSFLDDLDEPVKLENEQNI